MTMYDQIQETVSYLNIEPAVIPNFGIILGTGLSSFVDEISIIKSWPYKDIPHFAQSTVQSHKGNLILGQYKGQYIIILQGRFHYYEGYDMKQVTFPVRVCKALGIHSMLITNITGGINPDYAEGDIVVITDHINLHAENPLRGQNDERLGPRFPELIDAYDLHYIQLMKQVAEKKQITLREGVYAGIQGPNLETRAEYKYLHIIGGDVVGMSTIPEVVVARHASMKVCVLSCISNQCYPPENIKSSSLEDILRVVEQAGKKMNELLIGFMETV